MTDRDLLPGGDDPDVSAAELALGLIDGAERAAALRRLLAEPAFAREVEQWREHFATLFASIPEVAPPAEVEQRVVARLDHPSRLAPRPSPGLWRPLAIASSIAASLFGVLLVRPEPVAPPVIAPRATPALLVAAFTIEGFDKPVVATYDIARATLRMPAPMPIPAGRDAQLWAIVGDGAPQPLGLFHQVGDTVVAEAEAPVPYAPGTTFAISIEPLGGSPTGAPTGPVVGSGTLSQI